MLQPLRQRRPNVLHEPVRGFANQPDLSVRRSEPRAIYIHPDRLSTIWRGCAGQSGGLLRGAGWHGHLRHRVLAVAPIYNRPRNGGAGMSIAELIQLVSYKLTALNSARASAVSVGDLNQIVTLDSQIAETQLTLDQLRTLT